MPYWNRFTSPTLAREAFRLITIGSVLSIFACVLACADTKPTTPTDDSASSADKAANGSTASPSAAAVSTGSSDNSAEAAAKDAAQNPVAHVVSIPFQSNTYFQVGAYKRRENVTLIEPVIPFKLTDNWILITRTIMPVVYVPRVSPSEATTVGFSNLNPQFYLSPAHPGSIIWGVGPQLWLPTASDKTIGVNKWGGGPAAVVLTKRGHWLLGALVNNVWTGGAGRQGHQDAVYPTVLHSVNQLTLNPFAFYNMKGGWYFMTSPVITADWAAVNHDNRWTVPVGGGVGRVYKIGSQLLNSRVQFFNDVKTPIGGTSWQMQLQTQLLFPHK
jgi:hypothetical protein